jgi:hypothetical protein
MVWFREKSSIWAVINWFISSKMLTAVRCTIFRNFPQQLSCFIAKPRTVQIKAILYP